MSLRKNLTLKRMGVMNFTPNSFSDGGELTTREQIQKKLAEFKDIEAIDFGAESTAPMNQSIAWEEEWERFQILLPFFKQIKNVISIDTYHYETIQKMMKFWKDEKILNHFIWNDVSGKFDESVKDFLNTDSNFKYIFCHNQAPRRELTGNHMDYVKSVSVDELADYFSSSTGPQVIFDPCLGFSKTYEDNWKILENFGKLQKLIAHSEWLIGFSRKSFLRKKYELTVNDKVALDRKHIEEIIRLSVDWKSDLWVRTHRPELISLFTNES